jgi:hypothetical protein
MSKLICKCGHTIVDQAADLPFASTVLADRDQGALDTFVEESTKYFKSVAEGRRDEWLAGWYGGYAKSMGTVEDSSVISDIFSSTVGKRSRRLYRCEVCGRLHLQSAPESDRFEVFTPESG